MTGKALLRAMVVIGVAAPAWAQDVYRWKDERGVMHFTDSVDQVPPAYRNQKVGGALRGNVQVIESAGARPEGKDRGARLWERKCSECHHPGKGEVDEKEGLGGILVNSTTGFPEPVDAIVGRMREAVDGRFSDMPRISVSDEELRLIARFLLERSD